MKESQYHIMNQDPYGSHMGHIPIFDECESYGCKKFSVAYIFTANEIWVVLTSLSVLQKCWKLYPAQF